MKCSVKNCKREYEILYVDKPLCWVHWSALCDREITRDQNKNIANIESNDHIQYFIKN